MAQPINDINVKQWKEYGEILTDSLWLISRRDNSGSHAPDYWGNFIPQIPFQMMQRYTRAGDWVIDPFLGSGTTLIEAQRLGRNALGVELQPQVAEMALERIQAEAEAEDQETRSVVKVGNSQSFDFAGALRDQGAEKAQLAILHPPYFDIIQFSEDSSDLSNAEDLEQFLEGFQAVVDSVSQALEKDRYLCLVIGDKYSKGEWIPLGFQCMNAVLDSGYTLKSIVVKNFEETAGKKGAQNLWRYRALVGGFYVFKHEYVFVFKKTG